MNHPTIDIHHGDCIDVLSRDTLGYDHRLGYAPPAIADDSIDAVVTDPPYGLSNIAPSSVIDALTAWATGDRGFMPKVGRGFDAMTWDGFVPPPAVWDQVARVLKPGGHALVFAGSRTVDLMTLSLRLSGFEVKDTIMWAYGSGMPKSKGMLKPGYEPVIVVRKPFKGSAKAVEAKHGTGRLFPERARVAFASVADEQESKNKNRHGDFGTEQGGNTIYGDYTNAPPRTNYNPPGRWPANVMFTHSATCENHGVKEVATNTHFPGSRGAGGISTGGHKGQDGLDELRPGTEQVEAWACAGDCPVAELDRQSGVTKSTGGAGQATHEHRNASVYGEWSGQGANAGGLGDIGGASRFFHTTAAALDEARFVYAPKAKGSERPRWVREDGEVVQHHTVKPLTVMRTLLRLAVPEGGKVLDLFAGSGTTAEAALLEGLDAIVIEREADYHPLIQERIARASDSLGATT